MCRWSHGLAGRADAPLEAGGESQGNAKVGDPRHRQIVAPLPEIWETLGRNDAGAGWGEKFCSGHVMSEWPIGSPRRAWHGRQIPESEVPGRGPVQGEVQVRSPSHETRSGHRWMVGSR